MSKKYELSGLQFENFIVLCKKEVIKQTIFWQCLCNCGKFFKASTNEITAKKRKSCGCKRGSFQTGNSHGLKHGNSVERTPTYQSWTAMKARCYGETKMSKEYRDRNITVCDRWLESFNNFFEDVGERPDGMTLDRINVNGNYEPSNCRWASDNLQAFNQRKKSNNTSGKTGVYWCKNSNRWFAKINVNKQTIHLGYFQNIDEAKIARTAANILYYGFDKE